MKKVLLTGLIIVTTLCLAGSVALANATKTPKAIVIEKDKVLEGPQFLAGDTVTILGTINGDAYIAGGLVTMDGTVNGDVLIAGGQIAINGTVSENARIVGGNISLNGAVGKSASIAGGNFQLHSASTIGNSLVVAGGTTSVLGTIKGKTYVAAGNVEWSGTADRDVLLNAGQLVVNNGSRINGNLQYRVQSQESSAIRDGAVITGAITELEWSVMPGAPLRRTGGNTLVMTLVLFIGALVVGSLLIRFAPEMLGKTSALLQAKPWHVGLTGIVALVVTPIVTVLLVATLIGLPLGLLTLAAYIVALYGAQFVVGYWLGTFTTKALMKKESNPYAHLIVGLAILAIASIIPVLKTVVLLITFIVGIGAFVLLVKPVSSKQGGATTTDATSPLV